MKSVKIAKITSNYIDNNLLDGFIIENNKEVSKKKKRG